MIPPQRGNGWYPGSPPSPCRRRSHFFCHRRGGRKVAWIAANHPLILALRHLIYAQEKRPRDPHGNVEVFVVMPSSKGPHLVSPSGNSPAGMSTIFIPMELIICFIGLSFWVWMEKNACVRTPSRRESVADFQARRDREMIGLNSVMVRSVRTLLTRNGNRSRD